MEEGSARTLSAGTGTFEHWEADPAPCGARTAARSTRRDDQTTRMSKALCRKHLGEREPGRFGAQMSTFGNGRQAWCRLRAPSRELSDGPTISWCQVRLIMPQYPHTVRHDAQRGSDACTGRNAFAVSTRHSASPVSVAVSAVAVGTSIRRPDQHRKMSDSVRNAHELFRWPWNGRLLLHFPLLSTLRGGQKVTETVTYTRYLASGTCLTLCTVLIASIPVAVVMIENCAQKAFNGPV
jgi:hypothetical protein